MSVESAGSERHGRTWSAGVVRPAGDGPRSGVIKRGSG
jgi:hypothetical protein